MWFLLTGPTAYEYLSALLKADFEGFSNITPSLFYLFNSVQAYESIATLDVNNIWSYGVPSGVFAQQIYYVTQTGQGSKEGSGWENAATSLQGMIDGAPPGDQVWLAAGAYNGIRANWYEFVLKDKVSLYGGFAGTETAIDQRDLSTHVTKLNGGYSINNDNTAVWPEPYVAAAFSRAVYLHNSSPFFSNCTFLNNQSHPSTSSRGGNGAAVYAEGISAGLALIGLTYKLRIMCNHIIISNL